MSFKTEHIISHNKLFSNKFAIIKITKCIKLEIKYVLNIKNKTEGRIVKGVLLLLMSQLKFTLKINENQFLNLCLSVLCVLTLAKNHTNVKVYVQY